MNVRGKVYLIGAGPGDPDLLTVKAQRILRSAKVVLYDRLVSPEVLLTASPEAELIYVGKHEGEQEQTQQVIFDLMLERALQGQTVVRLKGGDPCVFGRAGEEWLMLVRSGIEVEVIPGVSSALAAPLLAGVPLTFRGLSRGFAVVTGHCAGRRRLLAELRRCGHAGDPDGRPEPQGDRTRPDSRRPAGG